MERLAENRGRAAQDDGDDEEAQDRIEHVETGDPDRDPARNHRHRGEEIAHDVRDRAPHVQVVARVALEEEEDGKVRDETDRRDHRHRRRIDRHRGLKAMPGLERDRDRDRDQRQSVQERGEHLGAVIAEGAARVGRDAREPKA